MKCASFLLNTKPPRKDTPFWIISELYYQSMGVCWAEKLNGRQFLPDAEIDFDRIVWHKPSLNWPFYVPLKPFPGTNKNWLLEFKSYGQGRAAMQARSIGGFWFSEQFPWELFVEVLRGCRDYMFRGGQFAEFTPINPDLCIAMEKILDKPPKGWGSYRLSTEENRPNLAPEWYDSFQSSVPQEMIQTRFYGALATFEGAIFQSFSPDVHVTDDDAMARLPGTKHHRGIDWVHRRRTRRPASGAVRIRLATG